MGNLLFFRGFQATRAAARNGLFGRGRRHLETEIHIIQPGDDKCGISRGVCHHPPGRWIFVLLMVACGIVPVNGGEEAGETSAVRVRRTERQMGVHVTITVYAPSEAAANRGIDAAFGRFEELNAVCSDYRSDSELMTACRAADSGEPVPISQDLLRILTKAEFISRATNGAFDVTVGPVVKLWRHAARQQELPSEDELLRRRSLVGYRQLLIDEQNSTLQFSKPGIRIDLGGIAKGYAADEAYTVLAGMGLSRCLIDASGDIRAGDPPLGRTAWKIQLQPLRGTNGKATEPVFVELANGAVATSGDLYQYVEFDGIRYSHIVDPRTGMGVIGPSSVTVVAETAADADAWASALSVLGPEGFDRLRKHAPKASAMISRMVNGEVETLHIGPAFGETCGER